MSGLSFFDTNIFLYADDRSDPRKQEMAITLIGIHQREGSLVVSLQVLQEYYAAATRKLGVAPDLAQKKVEILSRSKIVRFNPADVVSAIELHRLHQVSFWDAMIIHAARMAKVTTLFSEDLANGSTLAGVRVRNPFAV